jgi:GMP synthase (glutamine-hydrolysing)
MKVLLLQARRSDDPMMEHERQCFVSATGLAEGSFQFVNVVDRVPAPDELSAFDALMVGGAGHFSLTSLDEPFYEPLVELVRWVADEGFPTFASCFGFQLMVHAFGGRVEHDPGGAEVGSFVLRLSEAGRSDELFGRLPAEFIAQMGHVDRATAMPAGVPNLASSERSPLQALRLPGRPVWATQFHPELDQKTNHDRYLAYLDNYDSTGFGEQETGFTALPSPETSTLLPAFIELIGNSDTRLFEDGARRADTEVS